MKWLSSSIIAFLLVISVNVHSANAVDKKADEKTKKSEKSEEKTAPPDKSDEKAEMPEDTELKGEYVKKTLKDIYNQITKEDHEKKKLIAVQFISFANSIKVLYNHPDIELETEISKKWYRKLFELLVYMYPPRKAMDIAILNKDSKSYKEYLEKYNQQVTIFKNIIDNPQKLTKEQMIKIREKREAEEKKKLEAEKLQKQKEKAARLADKKKGKKKKAEDENEDEE